MKLKILFILLIILSSCTHNSSNGSSSLQTTTSTSFESHINEAYSILQKEDMQLVDVIGQYKLDGGAWIDYTFSNGQENYVVSIIDGAIPSKNVERYEGHVTTIKNVSSLIDPVEAIRDMIKTNIINCPHQSIIFGLANPQPNEQDHPFWVISDPCRSGGSIRIDAVTAQYTLEPPPTRK